MGIELTDKQSIAWELLEDKTTNTIVYGGAAGGGKSFFGCTWLWSMCIRYPGVRMAMARAEFGKLKKTTFKTLLLVFDANNMIEGVDYTINMHSDDPHVAFPNGSQIVLMHFQVSHKDPDFDRLGSLEISGIFIDEIAEIQYRAWSVIMGRIRYKLDEYGLVPKRFGSCNPTNTFVKADYYEPWKAGVLPNTDAFIEAKFTDNPYLSKTYGETISQMDDIDKRRYMGDWQYHEDGSNLFGVNKIEGAFNSTPIPNPKNKWYITCDVARFGRDLSVILVWDGMNVVKCNHYVKNTIPQLIEEVKRLAIEYGVHKGHIIVDTDGLGGAVTDAIGSNEYNNGGKTIKIGQGFKKEIIGSKAISEDSKAIKGEKYTNLKAQVTHVMAYVDWTWQCDEFIIKGKNGNIKATDYIKAELRVMSSIPKGRKRSVTDKDKVKAMLGRSCDFGDAIYMRGYFELRQLAII
jgi:hypothetical protein